LPGRLDIRPQSFIPSALALAVSTAALYELLGDVARQSFAMLHIRRHTA
jgi:hypothetical protein